MRPQVWTSTLLSASRLYSTTFASSTCSAARAILSPSVLPSTCAPAANAARLFSTSLAHKGLVKPQVETTDSKQNIRIPTPSTPVATTSTMAASSSQLLEAFKARRSFYQLNKDLLVPKEKITEIVQEALIQIPSAFHSQSNRVLLLYGADHEKFWDMTLGLRLAQLKEKSASADHVKATEDRIALFKAAAGTVLFFVDQDAVKRAQDKFAVYKDRLPTWAEHSTAMLQFAVWTTLETEGLGASLQHNNDVEKQVAAEWAVPEDWTLSAQLVFGGRAGDARLKEHEPLEKIFKVAGA